MPDVSQPNDASPRHPEAPGTTERHHRLEDAARVAGRVAHDFGNILTGILGFTELALAQMQPTSAAYRFLQEGYRNAQLGTQWIQQLRLFSRRGPVGEAVTDVRDLVGTLRERGGLNNRLHLDVRVALPPVAVDGALLHQALAHLLDNAAEAVGPEGRITLAARSCELTEPDCRDLIGAAVPGPHVEVRVADDGSGIAADVQERLFVEPLVTTKPRHRGLGLAVVYGIVRSHRGGLRVESSPGRGTTVFLYLPTAPVARREADRPADGPGASLAGTRVLVVDGDPLNLQLVCNTLEEAGCRVRGVACGAEALASYSSAGNEPFQLVLSDVAMPRMSGVDLARRLWGHDRDANVVFMSGQGLEDTVHAQFPDRRFDVVAKPIRSERLLGAVRSALERGARLSRPA